MGVIISIVRMVILAGGLCVSIWVWMAFQDLTKAVPAILGVAGCCLGLWNFINANAVYPDLRVTWGSFEAVSTAGRNLLQIELAFHNRGTAVGAFRVLQIRALDAEHRCLTLLRHLPRYVPRQVWSGGAACPVMGDFNWTSVKPGDLVNARIEASSDCPVMVVMVAYVTLGSRRSAKVFVCRKEQVHEASGIR
jgi:hypothetical protein